MERESVAEQDKTRNNKMFVLPIERQKDQRKQPTAFVGLPPSSSSSLGTCS